MFFKIFQKKVNDPDGNFDDGARINNETNNRNSTITTVVILLICIVSFGFWKVNQKEQVTSTSTKPIDFGAIVEDDFIDEDNQSALFDQQKRIDELNSTNDKLVAEMNKTKNEVKTLSEEYESKFKRFSDDLQNSFDKKTLELEGIKKEFEDQIINKNLGTNTSSTEFIPTRKHEVLGQRKFPPRATETNNKSLNDQDFSYKPADKNLFGSTGIDSYTFDWGGNEEKIFKRTVDNYVPTGTFVTAIVTGGADTNAGVLGQGDTVPMVFQTINHGVLPNGAKSRLKNCTITGSSYGEISSSRGIVRTDRMSCIFDDGEIIDLPVKGTVFNFGRNGIRGTTILRNGKIVQMAGVSGLLTGIGDTGTALSTNNSISALGATSSVDPSSAVLNLLGNATSSVGSKLSEYYIQLAELYHPIVELNQGNIVNIVFLEGFPLDSVEIQKRQDKLDVDESKSGNNQLLDVISNNPLANQLPPNVKEAVGAQTAPVSDFGTN